MCANFWIEIFRGYDLTGGRISRFLLIFAWALQQCSANALPVINQLITTITNSLLFNNNIKCKKRPLYNNVWGPSLSHTYKTAKNYFITSWADDIISSSYIFGPRCDKIIFCFFRRVTQWWALHTVIKRAVFYILHLLFFNLHPWLRYSHLENKRTPYGNFTSGFDFVLFIVIFM